MTEDICYMAVDGRPPKSSAVDTLCRIGKAGKVEFGFGEVVVLANSLPSSNWPEVEVRKIESMNLADYSRFTFLQLHLHTDKPFILVYQDDGYALNKDLWNPKFMDYDYVGAPWPDYLPWSKDGFKVGNGGFSLRSRKLCEFCSTLPFPNLAEDIAICVYYRDFLVKCGFKFAPVEIAREFSCELPIDSSHTIQTSFGFHGKHHMKLAEELTNG